MNSQKRGETQRITANRCVHDDCCFVADFLNSVFGLMLRRPNGIRDARRRSVVAKKLQDCSTLRVNAGAAINLE